MFTLTCSATAQPTAIVQTVQSLRKIKADAMDDPLPTAVRPLLTQLKRQLRELISDTLSAPQTRRLTPSQVRANVLAQLASMGVRVPPPETEGRDSNAFDTSYVYGDIHQITVNRPVGHPDLLAVTTTIGICCGEDSSLYLFKRRGRRWQVVLRQEANGYAEINGAQARFKYALAPSDKHGNFVVVTANVNPWCTSNWQQLRYRAMRIGRSANQPRLILKRDAIIYLGINPPVYRLKVRAQRFSLKFYGEADRRAIENGATTRRVILHYTVDGNRIRPARITKR
ncbi:MAG: hypothetical protein HYR56_33990 [Acidobacteria bacterium]|nr:hypothetical protein [Acidobacteriota bacterium]MBI3427758.1 hypothetical protein [Acidobacteriota bacterium]